MKNKLKFFVLLFIILIFSFSYVHATNETDTHDSDSTVSVKEAEVNKIITKNENKNKTVKTADTVQVNSYDSLASQLTGNEENKIINLKKATYKITNQVSIPTKSFSKNIVINGNGAVIDGSNSKSFLKIGANNNVTINNLHIKNTKAITQASGIIVSEKSSLTLTNCNFTNDVSSGKGGALINRGTTKINRCIFKSNSAIQGGAVWSTGEYGGSLQIENSKFISNNANKIDDHERTAVIYVVSGGSVDIISNTFEKNNGRSIHNYRTKLLVSNNTFKNILLKDPKSTVRGAVLDNYEANSVIIANTFNNISVYAENIRGGILYNEVGKSLFVENKITGLKVTSSGNIDSLNGGILFNRNSTLNVTDNKITNTNNGYKIHGGCLYNNIGILNVYRNTFNTKNTASMEISGGAIYNDKDGNLRGTLYYSANTNNLNNIGKVVSKTIHNLGTMKEKKVSIVKRATVITANPVNGIVGNKITLVANVKDEYALSVTGGSIIFKVGGKTLKTDGKFSGSAVTRKVSVKNGVARITITATNEISGTRTIIASYTGSDKYLVNTTKSTSKSVISLRNVSIALNATALKTKNKTLKFNVKLKDITRDTKTLTPPNNTASYVSFKINGALLKDSSGKQVKVKVNNGVATFNYVIPANLLNAKTLNVTVSYVHPDYKTTSKLFKVKC
ncbi:MAG: hypothetical protein BZ138_00605 [Methanosphaera sp. rholeuAM270]|nr:MAG: hypothetical protein BZ138_00605 [Methanosphaera sp. rholeuAM270]